MVRLRCKMLSATEPLVGERQEGFRQGRKYVDQNFAWKQVVGKESMKKKEVHVAFIDLQKLFDNVNKFFFFLV